MENVKVPMSTQEDLITYQLYDEKEYHLGIFLAISSSLFIGSSFIIKKKALIHVNRTGRLRAGAGGFGYLKECVWWTGLITMGIGEVANFAAYAFAPASLITPLGALSVLVSAILSSKCLKEKLNVIGKLGCVLCLLGTTIIIIHSPKDEEVTTLADLLDKLQSSLFIFYVFVVITVSILISLYYGPKYGSQNALVYIILCSGVGSLTVMCCKGLGLAIKERLYGKNDDDINNWLIYTFIITIIICISVQMNYLNKALDLFNTSIVTPIYYVLFTTLVLIASALLFKEWRHLEYCDIIGSVCGFLVIIIAIILLNVFKDLDINFSDVRGILRPKHEAVKSGNLVRINYGSNNPFI